MVLDDFAHVAGWMASLLLGFLVLANVALMYARSVGNRALARFIVDGLKPLVAVLRLATVDPDGSRRPHR